MEFVLDAYTNRVLVREQLHHARIADDPRAARVLCNLLQHLNEGVGYRHTWKPLRAAVSPRLGVPREARNEREVQAELVHQPLDVLAGVGA